MTKPDVRMAVYIGDYDDDGTHTVLHIERQTTAAQAGGPVNPMQPN
jgi:hypothetical protein